MYVFVHGFQRSHIFSGTHAFVRVNSYKGNDREQLSERKLLKGLGGT